MLLSLSGGVTQNQYKFASLANPLVLQANTSYFLVSQESVGGDQWYDFGPVTSASTGIVNGPVYTDGANHYIPIGFPSQSYVPVNFVYTTQPSLATVNIVSPHSNDTVSGNVGVFVVTTGSSLTLQFYVDGSPSGTPVQAASGVTFRFDSTSVNDGQHELKVVASNGASTVVGSSSVTVNVLNTITPNGSPFITGQSPGPLRNNYSGFVGFAFTVGANPIQVTSLGRITVAGNSGVHTLKLVNAADGSTVPGASVSLSMAGAAAGQYKFAAFPDPITLLANSAYYLVSQESLGGDQWFDYGSVSPSSIGTVNGPVYTDGANHYVPVGLAGQSYVPLNFLYGTANQALSVAITSPQNGSIVSGNLPVQVSTAGSVMSVHLQVDNVDVGSPSNTPPFNLALDTSSISNGAHSFRAIASDAQSNSAFSATITIQVNNAAVTGAPLITGQSPGALRNNYTGFVGFAFTVGATPIQVNSLGRIYAPGNTATHTVKLVQASNGIDVPGGSVSLASGGGSAGQFTFGALASSVTLLANTTYFLVSQEAEGGDQWYDYGAITTPGAVSVAGPTYTDGHNNYVVVGIPGQSYVPVNLTYQ